MMLPLVRQYHSTMIVLTFTFTLFLMAVNGQNEIEQEVIDGPVEERTLGHLISGGHALADSFLTGVLEGSYNLGTHLGQLGSPSPIGLGSALANRPYYGFNGYGYGFGQGCMYGYGGGCLPSSVAFNRLQQPYGGSWNQDLHTAGFPGTYTSKPYPLLDRNNYDYGYGATSEEIDEIAKMLFN